METAELRCVQRHGNCAEGNRERAVIHGTTRQKATVVVTFLSLSGNKSACTTAARSQWGHAERLIKRIKIVPLQKHVCFVLLLFLSKY